MTVKILSGAYADGYTLALIYTGLIIDATASVDGTGVVSSHSATIENYGQITSSGKGISLTAGGTIDNGGQIFAPTGVSVSGAVGSIKNYANIQGGAVGVSLAAGGSFTNESAGTVYGKAGVSITGAIGTIINYGSINSHSQGVTLTAGGVVENLGHGYIGGGIGVGISGGVGTVENAGVLYGVNLYAGGSVSNALDDAAHIDQAVYIMGGVGTVTNLAEIANGDRNDAVKLTAGGVVENGGAALPFGTIFSKGIGVYAGALATLANYGTVLGVQQEAVTLKAGGLVTNGTVNETDALIEGGLAGVAIASASAMVANFGKIRSTYISTTAHGVVLYDGGVITNGGVTDQDALIAGYSGLYVEGSAGTIGNFGTIKGTGVAPGTGGATGIYVNAAGVDLVDGGLLANGGITDRVALISGFYFGVDAGALATVDNFGTIESTGSVKGNGPDGVSLGEGGTLVNGGPSDQAALVIGYNGFNAGHAATIVNFGTIAGEGIGKSAGLVLVGGGVITNGAVNEITARIDGYTGVKADAAATIANFGAIQGLGLNDQAGVVLGAGGRITNGSAKDARAAIEGAVGVSVSGAGTVTNFATIVGDGGVAVQLNASSGELVEEAGSTLVGIANGGGGTLVLASGGGTLVDLAAGGDVHVSGSMPLATFVNFGRIEIGAGATFNAVGAATVAAAHTLENAGTLTLVAVDNVGTLEADGGVLTVDGSVTGAGVAMIAGGLLNLKSAFSEKVTFAAGSSGTLELTESHYYTGAIVGFSKTGATALELGDIVFADAPTLTYSGTTKSGVLTVRDTAGHVAKIDLVGDYLTSKFVLSAGPGGGVRIVDPATAPPAVAAPSAITPIASTDGFIQAAAGMAREAAEHPTASGGWRPSELPRLASPGPAMLFR